MTTKYNGNLKFMNKEKGYGFITTKDVGDVFVHITDINNEISMGDSVEFEIEETPKGNKAVNVYSNFNKS